MVQIESPPRAEKHSHTRTHTHTHTQAHEDTRTGLCVNTAAVAKSRVPSFPSPLLSGGCCLSDRWWADGAPDMTARLCPATTGCRVTTQRHLQDRRTPPATFYFGRVDLHPASYNHSHYNIHWLSCITGSIYLSVCNQCFLIGACSLQEGFMGHPLNVLCRYAIMHCFGPFFISLCWTSFKKLEQMMT